MSEPTAPTRLDRDQFDAACAEMRDLAAYSDFRLDAEAAWRAYDADPQRWHTMQVFGEAVGVPLAFISTEGPWWVNLDTGKPGVDAQ